MLVLRPHLNKQTKPHKWQKNKNFLKCVEVEQLMHLMHWVAFLFLFLFLPFSYHSWGHKTAAHSLQIHICDIRVQA